MRHADALSRCVNLVTEEYAMSKDKIKEEQDRDPECQMYKLNEKFWLDEDQLLYYEEKKSIMCCNS
jgi:hypothetical protein